MMVTAGVPLLALDPHPGLRSRRHLHDRLDGLRRIEMRLATDR